MAAFHDPQRQAPVNVPVMLRRRRRWYDHVGHMSVAVHLCEHLPEEISALVAEALESQISRHRRQQKRQASQVRSLGRQRVLGLYQAARRKRWYDAPENCFHRPLTMLGMLPDEALSDYADRIVQIARQLNMAWSLQEPGGAGGGRRLEDAVQRILQGRYVNDDMRLQRRDPRYSEWFGPPAKTPPTRLDLPDRPGRLPPTRLDLPDQPGRPPATRQRYQPGRPPLSTPSVQGVTAPSTDAGIWTPEAQRQADLLEAQRQADAAEAARLAEPLLSEMAWPGFEESPETRVMVDIDADGEVRLVSEHWSGETVIHRRKRSR